MASSERNILTRFAVVGEPAYRAAIKSINSEYRALESTLKVVNSDIKTNGANIDSLKAKQQALENVIAKLNEKVNTSKAQMEVASKAQADWAAKAADARQRMEQLTSSTDDAEKETDEYKDKIAELQAEINRYEAAEQTAKKAVNDHATEANNAQAKLNKFEGELKETSESLAQMSKAADDGSDSMDELGDGTDKTSKAIDELASALAAAGIVASLKEIAETLKECTDASVEFESAMAGVAKTTDLNDEELSQLGDAFKEMSTEMPIAATELAQIAEIAGQLGVPAQNLESFTKVMAELSTATNMTSEEAATMIAQFAAITGMDLSNVDRLGASIVALGNNFATNEQRITEMSQSIAGAATNAGMAETDMLALSTAVTSLGIEAGTGGTNMSKLISEMQNAVQTGEKLDTWAQAAGMTASEFSTLWGQDATSAILAFVQGLGSMGGEMNTVLNELGIGEERFKRMVTSLANAEQSSGMLTRAITMSSEAWQENTALVNEASTRYETTESKIEMFNNAVTNLKTAIGDQLTPALGKLAETGTDVTEWATEVVEESPELVSMFVTLTSAGAGFLATITVLPTTIKLAEKAFVALNAAITANPWMLAVAGVAAVVAGLAGLVASTQEANNGMAQTKELLEEISESAQSYETNVASIEEESAATDGLVEKLIELSEQTDKTAAQKALLSGIVDELNSKLPELALNYDAETDALSLNSAQIKAVAQAQAEQNKQQASIDRLNELYLEQSELEQQLADAAEELAEAQDRYTEAEENACEATSEGADGMDIYGRELMLAEEAAAEAQDRIDELTAALGENEAAIDELAESYGEASSTQSAYTEDEESLISYLTEATTSVSELIEKYKELGEAAVEGAEQTAGGLLNVVEVTESSSAEVIAALQSQTEFFNQYAENIRLAAEHGLNEGLVAALSDGSMESAQILAGLASEGWANIEELNAAFEASEEGKAALQANVEEANATADSELQAIIDKVDDMVDEFNKSGEASEAGIETITAYVDGLNSDLAGVSSVVSGINRQISQITRSVTTQVNINVNTNYSSSGRAGHASGLSYVPYDEYKANLHEGEMVLTRLQAEAYRAQQRAARYSTQNSRGEATSIQTSSVQDNSVKVNVSISKMEVRSEADIEKVSEKLAQKTAREIRYHGSSLVG